MIAQLGLPPGSLGTTEVSHVRCPRHRVRRLLTGYVRQTDPRPRRGCHDSRLLARVRWSRRTRRPTACSSHRPTARRTPTRLRPVARLGGRTAPRPQPDSRMSLAASTLQAEVAASTWSTSEGPRIWTGHRSRATHQRLDAGWPPRHATSLPVARSLASDDRIRRTGSQVQQHQSGDLIVSAPGPDATKTMNDAGTSAGRHGHPRVPVVVSCPRLREFPVRPPPPAPQVRWTVEQSRSRTRSLRAWLGELEPSRGFPRSSRIPRLWNASRR